MSFCSSPSAFAQTLFVVSLTTSNLPGVTSTQLSPLRKRLAHPYQQQLHHNRPHQHRPQPYLYARDWLLKIGSSNFTYQNLHSMLSKHQQLIYKVSSSIKAIEEDEKQQKQQQHGSAAVAPAQTQAQLTKKVLGIYQRELKAVEKSLEMVLRDLYNTLSSDYHSLENIKRVCKMRQTDMGTMAIQVEQDYNIMLELEKEALANHPNTSLQTHFSVLNQFLSEISHAADVLEKKLVENNFNDYKNLKGADFETVVKLSGGSLRQHKKAQSHSNGAQSSETRKGGGVSVLVDSASNHYILCRPRDMTVPIEDHHFIHDFINILLLSVIFGAICSLLRIPSFFGYVFTGVVLGPTGLNLIGCIVQVESLGEVGVVFIVFMVGLEFSPQKLQKVWSVAVYGGNLLLCSSIVMAILLGTLFQVDAQQSLFVAACLSFSSNPLASRILDRETPMEYNMEYNMEWFHRLFLHTKLDLHNDATLKKHKKPFWRGNLAKYQKPASERGQSPEVPESEVADSVVGILMMQDLQLGTLVALLPFFVEWSLSPEVTEEEAGGRVGDGKGRGWLVPFLQLLQVLFGFPLLVLIFRLIAGRTGDKFHRLLHLLNTQPRAVLMGSIALCFSFLMIAELLGASLELGSFLAGVVLSSLGPAKIDQVKRLIDPIKEVFAVFFFTSLGFHVYPSFLRLEFMTLCVVMAAVVLLKLLLSLCVLGFFLGHCQRKTLVVSVSLAQVSEFSFVLSSRARRIGIISREVYLVILGITTLSLLLSPILWRTLLHLHIPTLHRSVSSLSLSVRRTMFGR